MRKKVSRNDIEKAALAAADNGISWGDAWYDDLKPMVTKHVAQYGPGRSGIFESIKARLKCIVSTGNA